MLAHMSLGVTSLEKSKTFYDAVLAAIGQKELFSDMAEGFVAYGPEEGFFIICTPLEPEQGPVTACNGTHVCFRAPSREAVEAFHKTALDLGGICAGAPGLRAHYSPTYYAAYVRDPDGHKIEAVYSS